ncbi:phage major capsid protein, partial [Salmonella enterica subsp. enterica]|nr:phage major capsid protein [Salmonella enterica subsp. enterica serovar Sandiego]
AVKWQEILALKHSIDPAYRRGPKFRLAFNDNTLKLISEMEDGQGRPLWLPDIVGVAPASVLNVPYVIDQEIDDIGAGKKFMFCGDFNRFIIRRVRYMILKRLVERYAEYDQTGFLAFHRFDCILEDTSAIKALVGKGSASS